MTIIYVENVRIPSERAHAYQIVQTCAWLARLGHAVTLVTPERSKSDTFSAYGLPSGLFTHARLPVTDPLSWKWFPLKALAYAWERWSFARALRAWAQGRQADAWYTRDPAMVDVLRSGGRRFVLELHDAPDSRPDRWMRIQPYVERYVVISNGVRDRLVELGIPAEKICVAPDGYDPGDFRATANRAEVRRAWGIPPDAFLVAYTGGFYPWKGVDAIVQAWAYAPSDCFLFLAGGPDPDRRRLEALIPSSVRDRVKIVPYVPHREAIGLLAAADAGLLPSSDRFDISRRYTSPLKQFEYLAAGLPIIASDVPSSHEVLDARVAKFFAPTREGFLRAIGDAQSDAAWRASAREAGRERVKGYTWEARSRKVEDCLRH